MKSKQIHQLILLTATLISLSEWSYACYQEEHFRIETGAQCNSTGSLVLLHGQACLITKTVDVPVDTVIEYTEIFCMGTDFDDIQLEGWSTSKTIQSHTPRISILQYVTPSLYATNLGESHSYYKFSGPTFVPSNVTGQIINITWADYVMSNGKTVYSNVHHCQMRAVAVTGGTAAAFSSFALLNFVLLFTYFCF